jgi:arylsulfatase A-like enzyme
MRLNALGGSILHDALARTALGILGLSLSLGASVGCAAQGLLALHDALRSLEAPRPVLRQAAVLMSLVMVLHAALEAWGMAHDPALYAEAWYDHGIARRTIQVILTDVLGPNGVVLLASVGIGGWLFGPPKKWRSAAIRARAIASRHARLIAGGVTATAGVLLLLRAPAMRPAGTRPVDPRPNVLVLAADSLRADRLDARTAPHLTSLAATGTRFDRAYSSSPASLPSWVTLLTGRFAHHHGVRSNFPSAVELSRDFDALPERLATSGYATGLVSDRAGEFFARINVGFTQLEVPDPSVGALVSEHALAKETPLMAVLQSRLGRITFPAMRGRMEAQDPRLLAQDAIRMMRRVEGPRPFFLMVLFSATGAPSAAPAPYYGAFTDRAYRGRYKYDRGTDGRAREWPASAREQAQARALYDGAVLSVDEAAQSVLDAALGAGDARDTIIVVAANRGEGLYDGGRGVGHADGLFGDEGTHLPLLIIDPRRKCSHVEPSLVRDVDLAPTLYELTGTAAPADLDGRSLVPALDGKPLVPRLAYAEMAPRLEEGVPGLPPELRLPTPSLAASTELEAPDVLHGGQLVLGSAARMLTLVARHRMVRDPRWKLLYVPTRRSVRFMLFDTASDPEEREDVAALHPEVVNRLRSELWSWVREDPSMAVRDGYFVPIEVPPSSSTEARPPRFDDAQ